MTSLLDYTLSGSRRSSPATGLSTAPCSPMNYHDWRNFEQTWRVAVNTKAVEDMIETLKALRLTMLGAKVFPQTAVEDLFRRHQPELEALLVEMRATNEMIDGLRAEVRRLERSQAF